MIFPVPMLANLRAVPSGPSIALVQERAGASTDGSVPFVLPLADALVAGAGTSAANGVYTYRGQYNGQPFFTLFGQPTPPDPAVPGTDSIYWDAGNTYWVLILTDITYVTDVVSPFPALPWLATWIVGGDGSGDPPAPTVTATNTVQAGNSVLVQISVDTSVGTGFGVPPTLIGVVSPAMTQGVANEPANNIALYNYYSCNAAIEYSGVTFKLNKSGAIAANASEWSGLADAGPTSTDTNTGNDASVEFAALTPAGLTIVSYATVAESYSSGPTQSFVRMTPANVTGIFLESAYLIGSGTSPTWTLGSGVDWSNIGCTFGGA